MPQRLRKLQPTGKIKRASTSLNISNRPSSASKNNPHPRSRPVTKVRNNLDPCLPNLRIRPWATIGTLHKALQHRPREAVVGDDSSNHGPHLRFANAIFVVVWDLNLARGSSGASDHVSQMTVLPYMVGTVVIGWCCDTLSEDVLGLYILGRTWES